MKYAVTALVAYSLVSWPAAASAQSNEAIVQRLDALEKENAVLRDRVRRLESGARARSAVSPNPRRVVTSPVRAVATSSPPFRVLAEEKPFNWGGPHVGAFGGINGWNPQFFVTDFSPVAGAYNFPLTSGATGFGAVYGLSGGYDWQRDSLVFGVEGDIAGVVGGKAEAPEGGGAFGVPLTSSRTEAIATVRARAGLALDRTLIYVTAGYAAIETKSTPGIFSLPILKSLSQSSWTSALALGAGVEYAFDDHWTIGGEGLYLMAATNRNNETFPVTLAGVGGKRVTDLLSYGGTVSQAVAKFGTKYKF